MRRIQSSGSKGRCRGRRCVGWESLRVVNLADNPFLDHTNVLVSWNLYRDFVMIEPCVSVATMLSQYRLKERRF